MASKGFIPTRFPGGITNVEKDNAMAFIGSPSPFHEFKLGVGLGADRFPMTIASIATGNPSAGSTNDFYIRATTTSGTASLGEVTTLALPVTLVTTGTTGSDVMTIGDRRSFVKNYQTANRLVVAGIYAITSTVSNSTSLLGLAAYAQATTATLTDAFAFTSSGATLSFSARNNGGTTDTTSVGTIVVSTLYGMSATARFDKTYTNAAGTSVVPTIIRFGQVDGPDLRLAGVEIPIITVKDIPLTAIVSGASAAGTTAVYGLTTTAGAAGTARLGGFVVYGR
jgi:hypothetical protein